MTISKTHLSWNQVEIEREKLSNAVVLALEYRPIETKDYREVWLLKKTLEALKNGQAQVSYLPGTCYENQTLTSSRGLHFLYMEETPGTG
jgi:hypothetical protein